MPQVWTSPTGLSSLRGNDYQRLNKVEVTRHRTPGSVGPQIEELISPILLQCKLQREIFIQPDENTRVFWSVRKDLPVAEANRNG